MVAGMVIHAHLWPVAWVLFPERFSAQGWPPHPLWPSWLKPFLWCDKKVSSEGWNDYTMLMANGYVWYEIYVYNYVYALMFRAYKLHTWCIMTCLWMPLGGSHSLLAPWRGCKIVFIVHVDSGGTNKYILGWIRRKMYIRLHTHTLQIPIL